MMKHKIVKLSRYADDIFFLTLIELVTLVFINFAGPNTSYSEDMMQADEPQTLDDAVVQSKHTFYTSL